MQEDTPPSGQPQTHHTSTDNKPGQAAPVPGHAHDGADKSQQATTNNNVEEQGGGGLTLIINVTP